MPIYQAVILALVQAATEFLPVSSTAHLILAPWLLGWQDQGLLFDVALHLGTLAAVLLYFAKTWVRLLFAGFGRTVWPAPPGHADHGIQKNPLLFWYLVAATFPAGIAGLLFQDQIESTFRSPVVIGVMLIVVGAVLWWAERVARLDHGLGDIPLANAMIIGCAQALALVPGTSRSGVTISAGLFRGFDRATAARFSFLLSSPIILGASAKAAIDVFREGGIPPDMWAPFAVGVLVSAVAGYGVIALFLRYLQNATLRVFVVYRIIFGIIVLALAFLWRFPGAVHL